jgi:hypothetical protein
VRTFRLGNINDILSGLEPSGVYDAVYEFALSREVVDDRCESERFMTHSLSGEAEREPGTSSAVM